MLPAFIQPLDMTFWNILQLGWPGCGRVLPLCGHPRKNGDHQLQRTGLYEYPAYDIVSWYWKARSQMIKKPRSGTGYEKKEIPPSFKYDQFEIANIFVSRLRGITEKLQMSGKMYVATGTQPEFQEKLIVERRLFVRILVVCSALRTEESIWNCADIIDIGT
ncbi:hypothetical protein TNCV_1028401 [Trichonephila clavipes]|nr:hypothetical protein TNCV_1028401 [Trichonephila clavipes]